LILLVAGGAYGLGFIWGRDPIKHLLTATAIAVAAVPEGLPAIISMTMVRLRCMPNLAVVMT